MLGPPGTVDMEAEPEAAAALVALGLEPSASQLGVHSPSVHTSVGLPNYLLKECDLLN